MVRESNKKYEHLFHIEEVKSLSKIYIYIYIYIYIEMKRKRSSKQVLYILGTKPKGGTLSPDNFLFLV